MNYLYLCRTHLVYISHSYLQRSFPTSSSAKSLKDNLKNLNPLNATTFYIGFFFHKNHTNLICFTWLHIKGVLYQELPIKTQIEPGFLPFLEVQSYHELFSSSFKVILNGAIYRKTAVVWIMVAFGYCAFATWFAPEGEEAKQVKSNTLPATNSWTLYFISLEGGKHYLYECLGSLLLLLLLILHSSIF